MIPGTAGTGAAGTRGCCTDPRSRVTQVAGPLAAGRVPRLDGSARPGVPLSQGSQLLLTPRSLWLWSVADRSQRQECAPLPPVAPGAKWYGHQTRCCKARPPPSRPGPEMS